MLTIKELAPYLPYRLKCKTKYGIFELNTIKNSNIYKVWFETTNNHNNQDFNYKLLNELKIIGKGYRIKDIKPILRPLSDLIKEIEVNGKKFVPAYRTQLHINNRYLPFTVNGRIVLENRIITNTILYTDMQYLISLHFDVFGLIEKDLAININNI